jgi:hypothetical protein
MPTGYTSDVENGKITSLKDFALKCSNAWLYDGRPPARPPKEREMTHTEETLAEAEIYLAYLKKEDWNHLLSRYEKEIAERKERFATMDKDQAKVRKRYEAMMKKVKAWKPPSPKHQNLKTFMISQIVESKRWDCPNDPWRPKTETFNEWYARELEYATIDVASLTESVAKERKNADEEYEWFKTLYKSFKVKYPKE